MGDLVQFPYRSPVETTPNGFQADSLRVLERMLREDLLSEAETDLVTAVFAAIDHHAGWRPSPSQKDRVGVILARAWAEDIRA